MKIYRLITLIFVLASCFASAQTAQPPTTIDGWADRLMRFGKSIPQEKVFVHMDNTCYFLGDTIWFAAYTRRTDKDMPSDISRVLYAELLNEEGYLVERQLVEMRDGRGHGNFVLPDTVYGGYYELRAYTSWQLNWGRTEKAHTPYAEDWFFNKRLAKEFYTDYEKIYSRVFPVYNKPLQPDELEREMTSRPLRRYFASGEKEPKLTLTLYPEGGNLVAGVPNYVAFEAALENGQAIEGTLSGEGGITAATVNRGRGTFVITPTSEKQKLTFTAKDGSTAKATLPAAETDGVALHVEQSGASYIVHVNAVGAAASQPLGLTIMHEGVVEWFEEVKGDKFEGHDLPAGIHQATVFDAAGRVWADRLFFVAPHSLAELPHISVSGAKDQYQPFETATLEVSSPAEAHISLAVRDLSAIDYTYDTSDILTEMLLASELCGYIPDPAYFFEADDDEHRTALDLLMMTQGWRRFDWRTMATPQTFEIIHPAETQTQILRGEVLKYESTVPQDEVKLFAEKCPLPYELEKQLGPGGTDYSEFRRAIKTPKEIPIIDKYVGVGQGEVIECILAESRARELGFPHGSYRMSATIATNRFIQGEGSISRPLRVHAEFTQKGSESVVGDVDAKNGKFTVPTPRFTGYCVFFLGASDTTKWKGKPHQWVTLEDDYKPRDPEFYVRLSWPYPRFTRAYSYYQQNLPPSRPESVDAAKTNAPSTGGGLKGTTTMKNLTVSAKRGRLRSFANLKPAYVVDAYQAYNEACDAGLMNAQYRGRFHYINSLARLYVGDMNTPHVYLLEPRYNRRNVSFNFTNQQLNRFNLLTNLDNVYIYTDFQPRNGADPRATEDNIDRVVVDVHDLENTGQRVTYVDRRYILQGFNVPDEFYAPRYNLPAGATPPADYRRTLYWNPDLHVGADGKTTVTFSAGTRPAILDINANGIAPDGTLLTTP